MMAVIPAGTVEQQLRAALREGRSPEEATRLVIGPYRQVLEGAGNASLADYSRPAVLAAARRLHRQMERRREDRAFQAAPGTRERSAISGLSFHLPDGTVVGWADATAAQHEKRVAWLQTYISSMEQDLRRHERILKLLAARGAERLSEIGGWEELVGDDLDDEAEDASGDVAP